MNSIKKVVVIGSGVMGSAIAAQVANSQTKIVLLDLVSPKDSDRSKIAREAKDKLLTARPAPLSHFSNSNLITVGNLEDDLDELKGADLIIEVIIEKLAIKHDLYKKIAAYMSKNKAILASNTSTLPLRELAKGLPKELHSRFFISHFFNPPRYMELLELVSPGDCQKNQALIVDFIERKLGKTVIHCNDTPGFIANRIGCFFLEMAVRKAIHDGLNPAIIDAIAAKYFSFPSTGIFALYDLIGHDVMELISKSLTTALKKDDRYNKIYSKNSTLNKLLKDGNIGRKSGAGFFKVSKETDASGKSRRVVYYLDFVEQKYHDNSKIHWPNLPSKLDDFLDDENEYSQYFEHIMLEYFNYAASIHPEVTEHIADIDDAMKLGYGMKLGPFELLRKMPKKLQNKITDKTKQLLQGKDTKQKTRKISEEIISQNDSALTVKRKAGYFFFLQSKMGVLNSDIFSSLISAINLAEKKKEDLYICSKAPVFSAGADLRYFQEKILNKNFDEISKLIKLGQQAMMRLKYSTTKITTAAAGLALGGGAEILLHSRNKIIHQNINAGLVEVSVGLIPGWGGTKEMLVRAANDHDLLVENISNIIFHRKTESAEYFNEQYHLGCTINMNKRYIIDEAVMLEKQNCRPLDSDRIVIPKVNLRDIADNQVALDELQLNLIRYFQHIVDNQTYKEEELLTIEHDKFIELCKAPYALERISKLVSK